MSIDPSVPKTSVLLVGQEAGELQRSLVTESTFVFDSFPSWQDVKNSAPVATPAIIVSDTPPQDASICEGSPNFVMRPAFAWENGSYYLDPPGWDFTRRALLDRLKRERAGRPPFRAMIVDDETGIRTAMRAMLARFGFDVSAESDRERSIESLREKSVDLLLTDVNMPGMTWVDYVRKVREITPSTKIYLATGDRAVSAAEGIEGILFKPFGLADVTGLAYPLLEPS